MGANLPWFKGKYHHSESPMHMKTTISRIVGFRVITTAFVAVLLGAPATFAAIPTYDLSRDYSTNTNPSGVWSYGYKSEIGGSFVLYPRLWQYPENPPGA